MPDNHGLRLTLAETLAAEERAEEAAAEYAVLHRSGALPVDALVDAGRVAVQAGDLALAGELVDAARRAGLVEGLGSLQREIDEVLGLGGMMRGGPTGRPRRPGPAPWLRAGPAPGLARRGAARRGP